MIRYCITTIGTFLLMMGFCFGQSEENKETLEKVEENIDGIEESLEENRERLKVLPAQTLKDFNKSLEGLQVKLDSLENKADRRIDSAYGKDTLMKEKDEGAEIVISGNEFNLNLGEQDEEGEGLETLQADYLVFDLGFNNYLNNGSTDLPDGYDFLELRTGKSVNTKLTLVKVGVGLFDHHVSILSGLGIDWNNYRFNNNTVLTSSGADTLSTQTFSDGYKKYKLLTQYGFIPLELRFDTKPENGSESFHFAVGGRFGYLIHAHTKVKMGDGDKNKDFDDFNLRQYKLGGVVRMGIGNHISLYANYDLTNLFQDDVGTDLNPVALGVTINGFSWD